MKLVVKLLVAFVVTALAPVVTLGVLSYDSAREALQSQNISDLTLTADAVEGHLYSYFDALTSRAIDFSTDDFILKSTETIRSLEPSSPARAELQAKLSAYLRDNKMTIDPNLHQISIVDLSGKIVASTNDQNVNRDAPEMNRAFLSRRGTGMADDCALAEAGSTHPAAHCISAFAPLSAHAPGAPLGLLINAYDTRQINAILAGTFQIEQGAPSSLRGARATLDIYLVDKHKRLLTPARFSDNSTQAIIDTKPVQGCLAGRETSALYTNSVGTEVLGASMCVPSLGWTLITEIGTEEALAPASALKRQTAETVLVIALLILVIAYLVSTRIAKPVVDLSEGTTRVAAGDFGARVQVLSGDEIGDLAASFNRMVAQLAESQDAAREEKTRLETLIRDVKEGVAFADKDDNVVMLNPMAEAALRFKAGDVIGKPLFACHGTSNEKMREVLRMFKAKSLDFYRADATYHGRHFEVMMSPIWSGRTYLGTVKVLHDITERKQAEEAALQANANLRRWVVELEQRNQDTALLNEMNELLQSCLSMSEAYNVVARSARKLFTTQSGAVFAISESRKLLEEVVSWTAGGDIHRANLERVIAPDECWAIRRGQLHVVSSTSTGLVCGHVEEPRPANSLCVPLMAQGDALGVFFLKDAPVSGGALADLQPAALAARQLLATTVGNHIALSLANLRLRETLRIQSTRDPLTGLFNRRYMEESLERELRRAGRSKRPLAVVMIDVDHFKRFNDTNGHEAGDTLLRALGALLRTQIREEDVPCRYGGEEFTLILPDMGLETALQRTERLRAEARHMTVPFRDRTLGSITLSFGVAIFPEHGATAETLLRVADLALYRAKEEGRDRVVVGQPLAPQGEG